MVNIRPRDRYRSMPGTKPLRMDHRGITAHDIDAALEHARYGVQPEYLNDSPRYPGAGGIGSGASVPPPPRAPYQNVRFEDSDVHCRGNSNNNHHQHQRHQHQPPHNHQHEVDLNELVRKTNLAVSLANHNISHRAQFSQIHPMMCLDGRFPGDFQTPRTVESVRLFDSTLFPFHTHLVNIPLSKRNNRHTTRPHPPGIPSPIRESSSPRSQSIPSTPPQCEGWWRQWRSPIQRIENATEEASDSFRTPWCC